MERRLKTKCWYLFDVRYDRYRIVVNAYFQAWSISRLVIVLTKAASALFIKWSGEYFLK